MCGIRAKRNTCKKHVSDKNIFVHETSLIKNVQNCVFARHKPRRDTVYPGLRPSGQEYTEQA